MKKLLFLLLIIILSSFAFAEDLINGGATIDFLDDSNTVLAGDYKIDSKVIAVDSDGYVFSKVKIETLGTETVCTKTQSVTNETTGIKETVCLIYEEKPKVIKEEFFVAELTFNYCDNGKWYRIYKADDYYTTQEEIIANGYKFKDVQCSDNKLTFLVDSFSSYTQEEIDSLKAGMIAYYPLDSDGSDYLGSYDLENPNGAVFTATGVVGNAVDMDDTLKQILNTTNFVGAGSSGLTMSYWVKIDNIPTTNYGYSAGFYGGTSPYVSHKLGLETYQGNSIGALRVPHGSSTSFSFTNRYSYSIDTWYHLTVTTNSSEAHLYLNGVEINSSSSSVGTGTSGTNTFKGFAIGRDYYTGDDSTNRYTDGKYDEFYVWERALEPTEVEQLYTINTEGFTVFDYPTGNAPITFTLKSELYLNPGSNYNTFTANVDFTDPDTETLNQTEYTTTNGTIYINVTGTYNVTFSSSSFISKTYLNQENDLNASVWEAELYLDAEDSRGNALTPFSITDQLYSYVFNSSGGTTVAYIDNGAKTFDFTYSDFPVQEYSHTFSSKENYTDTFNSNIVPYSIELYDLVNDAVVTGFSSNTSQYNGSDYYTKTGLGSTIYSLDYNNYEIYYTKATFTKSGYNDGSINYDGNLGDSLENKNYILFPTDSMYIEVWDGASLLEPQTINATIIEYTWQSSVCSYSTNSSYSTTTGIFRLTSQPNPQDAVSEGQVCKVGILLSSTDYESSEFNYTETDLDFQNYLGIIASDYYYLNTTLVPDTNFVVYGFNFVDSAQVTNMTISIDSSVGTELFYSLGDYKAVTTLNKSESELVNITITAPGYLSRTFTNVNTSTNYEAYLYPNKLTINIKDWGTGNLIANSNMTGDYNYNFTTGSAYLYLNSDNYSLNFSALGYFTENYEVELTGGQTQTLNAYIRNATIYISAIDEAGDPVNIFNITGTQGAGGNLGSNYTTGGNASLLLSTGTSATITIDAPGFAYQNYTFTPTSTPNFYQFSLIEENSVDVNVYNITSGLLITQNVTLQVVGADSGVYYSTNGTFEFRNMTAGEYDFIFSASNFTQKTYTITIGARSYQTLNAYLSASTTGGTGTNDVVFTFLDKDSGNVISGVTAAISTKVNSTYTLVDTISSDITGRIQVNDALGEDFRIIASKTGYNNKNFTLEPVIFNTYNVYMTKNISSSSSVDEAGVQIYLDPEIFYSNSTQEFTFTIANPDGKLQSYGFNISYNAVFHEDSGVNAYGESLNYNVSIPASSSLTNTITIKYYYTLSDQDTKTFTRTYIIQNPVISAGTHWYNKGNTYGLGLLERVLIVLLIALALSGVAYIFSGSVGAGMAGLVVFGYFTYMGFLSAWITIPSMIGLFLISAGGLSK